MSDPMIPLYEPWDPCFCDGPWLDIQPGDRPESRLDQEHQRGCVVNDVARCLFPGSVMKLYDQHRPLVLAILSGGLVHDWATAPGTGEPECWVIDFDREGEDDDERGEWCDQMVALLAAFTDRGIDVGYLIRDVEEMRP